MTDTKSTMFYSLEKSMYDAFSKGYSAKFGELVRPDALMICGGMGDLFSQARSGFHLCGTA